MDFSALFMIVSYIPFMTYLTFGKERNRSMLFPDYFVFADKRLVNHIIETKYVKDLDHCELFCYMNDNCVSANFKKEPETGGTAYVCELNNATHLEYDTDLSTNAVFLYRGSKNVCGKNLPCQNNATCQSGFTIKGYRCLCPPGFEGEHCEKDIDECQKNTHDCHLNATCQNTNGSFVCTCSFGFNGDGRNCTDIDECARNLSCHVNANCTNTIGSHVCTCHTGYTRDGQTCSADPCYNYRNLSDADRKSTYNTPYGKEKCDDDSSSIIFGKWYRFVGDAGTKMPTWCVPRWKCGAASSGWLKSGHPTLADGEVSSQVCFNRIGDCCKISININVKDCGSYFIYKLQKPPSCYLRYCSTD
ncbi:uromodulin-like isoform X1 [Pocillopora damicornis]|uniref:uromodulin-like isoform X1 n=1 Tax=Pocillopora damicornis TaxID=46731 RepID=UPI000F5558AB|nr:uromodulin-like isoform X1 [Pocillopora damicornis]